jgi:coatomer protein complex subunit gamma
MISLQVRDRATLYLNTLGGDIEIDKDVRDFLFGSLDIPLVNLETSLKKYVRPIYCCFFQLILL